MAETERGDKHPVPPPPPRQPDERLKAYLEGERVEPSPDPETTQAPSR
jgi:hypothetical protein